MKKQTRDNKRKLWIFRVLVPSVIIAIITITAFLFIEYYTAPTYYNASTYLLTGDTSWVKNREWLVYNPATNETLGTSRTNGEIDLTDYPSESKFAITHPDWKLKFIAKNLQAEKCQTTDSKKDEIACARTNTTELKLDRKLNNRLDDLLKYLTNRQWDKLSDMTNSSGTPALSEQLEQWSAALIANDEKVQSVDVYLDFSDQPEDGNTINLFAVFQLQNTKTGGVKLQNRTLTLAADTYKWNFSPDALPK
jgi:hypothetical protein